MINSFGTSCGHQVSWKNLFLKILRSPGRTLERVADISSFTPTKYKPDGPSTSDHVLAYINSATIIVVSTCNSYCITWQPDAVWPSLGQFTVEITYSSTYSIKFFGILGPIVRAVCQCFSGPVSTHSKSSRVNHIFFVFGTNYQGWPPILF